MSRLPGRSAARIHPYPFLAPPGWALLYFISTNPVVWIPVLVGYRNDKNMAFFHRVHQFVWKLVKEVLPYITPLYGPHLRMPGDSYRGLSHFLLEPASKP